MEEIEHLKKKDNTIVDMDIDLSKFDYDKFDPYK